MNIININDNSNKLFYIGGVVRDEILGKESFDIDITYVGNAIDYCSKFGEVIQENPDFGTVKVQLNACNDESCHCEGFEYLRNRKVNHVIASEASQSHNKPCHCERPTGASQSQNINEITTSHFTNAPRNDREDEITTQTTFARNDKQLSLRTTNGSVAISKSSNINEITTHSENAHNDKNVEIITSDSVLHEKTKGNNENYVIVDFASTRSETYPQKGHLPVVEKIGCSLKEDVMRRDFTINALAKSVTTGEIVDYTGGLEDIKNKKLRVLHDESFIDDPTRIIRALKFSVRFGFELEEHTRELQEQYLSNINYDMSYKRVKKELIETFDPHPNFSHSRSDNDEILPSPTEKSVGEGKVNDDEINPHPNFCHSRSDNGEILPSPTKKNVGEGKIQLAFEKFINEKIYKLVTPIDVELPKINIEKLIDRYDCEYKWLVYVGVLGDLSRLPLAKIEQKILDDVPKKELKTDFEIYKAFENIRIESVLLYGILYDEKVTKHYLDNLCHIKIETTGEDLKKLNIPPSSLYQNIFDEILKFKLKNPEISKEDELRHGLNFFKNSL